MTNPVNTFSKNPEVDTTKQEETREKSEKQIKWEVKDKITTEEFRYMTLDDLVKNLRIIDWKLTIFWKNLDYFYEQVLISDEDNDKLDQVLEHKVFVEQFQKQFKLKSLLNDILDIWQTEGLTIAGQLWFKGYRKDDNIILDNIKKMDDILKDFWVPVDEKIFNAQVESIFKLMEESENQRFAKWVIWIKDFSNVKQLFFEDISIEEKQIQIFNLMRYGWWSWNNEKVKEKVADKLIWENTDFIYIENLLNNSKFDEIIENDIHFWDTTYTHSCLVPQNSLYDQEMKLTTGSLIAYLSKFEYKKDKEGKGIKLWDKLASILAKIIIKKQELIKEKFKQTYNEKKESWEFWENDTFELYLENNKEELIKHTLYEVKNSFKHVLLRQEIEAKKNRWTEENSLTWIYANIIWLWETQKGDVITISDEYIDLAIDFTTTLAIWAMTMWSWALAIKWTKYLHSIWKAIAYTDRHSKLARIVYTWSKALKFWKYKWLAIWWKTIYEGWYVWELIWSSVLEWLSFYEWATFIQNAISREKEDWNKWLWDKKEFVKNIAFMWSLNSLKFLSKIQWMPKIMNFEMKIPEEYLKPWNFKKVLEWTWTFWVSTLRDWNIMFWISLLTDKLVWEEWNPTVREYIEFVTLIQLMHLKDMKKRHKK